MKVVYILLVVLLLVGGYYFVAGPPNRIVETDNAQTETDTETESESLPTNDGAEAESEEVVEEPDDDMSASLGSDVGMEFPIPDADVETETKVFNVTGFNYGYDVSEIRVQEGDTVTINLSVSDGFHDWVLDEFSAATAQIRAGGLASVTFVADRAGTYEYYCSVGAHRAQGMVGTLIVE